MKTKIRIALTAAVVSLAISTICAGQETATESVLKAASGAKIPPSPKTGLSLGSDDCKTLANDDLKRAKLLSSKTDEEFKNLIQRCDEAKITSVPMILSYKTVRDNFGKRVGDNFMVVQVNIQNKSMSSQFYVTDVQVWLDPGQCNEASEFALKSVKVRDESLDAVFNPADCMRQFGKYFKYPIALEPMLSDRVTAVGVAAQYRSPRKIGFQVANFVASMGSVLTGLKLLGTDGIKAFGFLGNPIIPSAETAIPDISAWKFENLKKASADETIIVKPNSSKVITIFIETDTFFDKDTWVHYKSSLKKTSADALDFRRLLKLFTVSSVDGILISGDSKKVTASSPGVVPLAQRP